jgi:predicted transposase YbfD/YdcC
MIVSECRIGEKTEQQTSYYITCLESDAENILKAKRSHWSVENRLYWVMDIAFKEDQS